MSRPAQPWRRGGPKGPWYAQLRGKQIFLAPPEATKTEAREALDQLRVDTKKEKKRPGGHTFRDVVNLFLARANAAVSRSEMAALTAEGYFRFLVPAAEAFGKRPASAINPAIVLAWLDGESWGSTTRNNALTAIKACLNWAKKMGHLAENPIRDMPKPAAKTAKVELPGIRVNAIVLRVYDQPFRDLMLILMETGMRPSEAMNLESSHLDMARRTATFAGKTTRKTGKPRIIRLSDGAIEILERLMKANPTGPLLRNRNNTPWNRHTIGNRFRRLRERLELEDGVTAKSIRHGFCTDSLVRGNSVAVTAELMGHTSSKMVDQHYSHIQGRTEHLLEAIEKMRPGQDATQTKPDE